MKTTEHKLRRLIREALLKEYGAANMEAMSPLVAFAQAYSGLGDALQSQIIDLVNAHIEGRIEDAVYEMNPNALDRAFEKLQQPLSTLGRDGSEDAMDMMDAMEQAKEIFAEGDAEVDTDARAGGDR